MYDLTHVYGNRGNEMRAISALEVALWDILGQHAGLPIYRLLGGASRDRIRIYNTCAGPQHARSVRGPAHKLTAPAPGQRYDDFDAFTNRADELARELLSSGITAMKIWPFDGFADMEAGLDPVSNIRDAVGMDMEILIEGHGYWTFAAAPRIAEALEPYRPMWIEDVLKPDCPGTLARLRRQTRIPICGSELALTRYGARELLEQEAVDIMMTDVTWTGGIAETKLIAAMAEARNLPFVTHDAAGPVTFLASIHLSLHCPNAMIQESVRAYYLGYYRELLTALPRIEDGYVYPPTDPGLGAALRPEVFDRPDVTVKVEG